MINMPAKFDEEANSGLVYRVHWVISMSFV